MDDLNLQPLLKTKRQQVSRACGNCRKAKTACSDHRPCQRCVKFNLQSTCEDAPRKQRANPDPKKPKSPRRTTPSPGMTYDSMEVDEPMTNSIEFLQNGMEAYHQPQFIQSQYQQQYYQQQPQYIIPPYQTAQPFPHPVPYTPQYMQPPFQQTYPPSNQPSYPPFQQPQPQPVVQPQPHFQTYNNTPQNQTIQTMQPIQSQTQTQTHSPNYQMEDSPPNKNSSQSEFSSVPELPNTVTPEENPLVKISGSHNVSFGSAGSLTELMQMRTPSLESLIVTVNSEITKKKKQDSFSSIPPTQI